METSQSQPIVILGLLILIALLLILFFILKKNKQIITPNINSNTPNPNTATAADLVNTQQAISILLQNFEKQVAQNTQLLQHQTQQRLDHILTQLNQQQQSNSQQLLHQQHQNTTVIQQVTHQLANIERLNGQILGFAEQMRSLEKILQNPKQRGILGEYLLETLLANVLAPAQFQMQYRFANGQIVDAVIFFKQKIIPIDAKFSLEKYNLIFKTDNAKHRTELERAFKTDLKNRIDETAQYIRPNENTTDFAFMFIPAEGVYYHLLSYADALSSDFIEYAFKKKVVVVSPMSFYAYLETVLQGLKALQIEENIKEVLKKMNDLKKNIKDYEQYMEKVGKNLHISQEAWTQARKEWQKIDQQVLNFANKTNEDNSNPTTNLNKEGTQSLF